MQIFTLSFAEEYLSSVRHSEIVPKEKCSQLANLALDTGRVHLRIFTLIPNTPDILAFPTDFSGYNYERSRFWNLTNFTGVRQEEDIIGLYGKCAWTPMVLVRTK